jgi:hypothetical protein
MDLKHLSPLEVAPAPAYPVPLLWRRGAMTTRARKLVAACSAGLCIAGCGAAATDARPLSEALEASPAIVETGAERSTACAGRANLRTGSIAVVFDDRMGSSFRLTRVAVALDGEPVFERDLEAADEAEPAEEIAIVDERVAEGSHNLAVHLEYRGAAFGVGYLRGISFRVASTHHFVAGAGQRARLAVIAFEQGGVTTPLEERPAVRFELEDLGCE